jgi:hypothetical protein
MKISLKTHTRIFLSILLAWGLLITTSNISLAQAVKVEVVNHDGKYQLLRNGKPYWVNGTGLADASLDRLAAHGGNSIRTWTTVDGPEGTAKLLDEAHELGITVSLCVYIGSERHGFDYYDDDAVARQYAAVKQEILKYKDHPALLTWIIGNELNFDYKNPKVYDAVNDISRMIHEIDPNHPTTTTIAGFSESLLKIIDERAPDLDFISFQLYGQLYNLPGFIKDTNFSAPYFITEWGAIGHWEVPKTSWGAPLEQDSSTKADTYLRGYQKVIEPFGDQIIGNYVFLWGQKQEKTPTWYGLFTETGEDTEVIDVLHYIWTGNWPENRTPRIKSMRLDGKPGHKNVKLKAGKKYQAKLKVQDEDGDSLTYVWQVKKESDATQVGGDFEETISNLTDLIVDPTLQNIQLIAPQQQGAYRLFVYAYDGQGHAAHANIPFYVDP